jgi:hypothetical protein
MHFDARVDDVARRDGVDEALPGPEVTFMRRALERRHAERVHPLSIGLAMRVPGQRCRGEHIRIRRPRQRHDAQAVVAAIPRDLEIRRPSRLLAGELFHRFAAGKTEDGEPRLG